MREGKVLDAELRHAVGRDRPGHDLLARRIGLGVAVDRRRGRVDDARAAPRRRLEEAPARVDVPRDVELEPRPEARADAGLAGEMEDGVHVCEEAVEVGVEQVLLEHDAAAVGVRALARGVVVVGERVEPDDVVPLGDESLGEVRPDESRGAGDEVAHQACPGSAASGSGSSSANGTSSPSSPGTRQRSEKNRVITTPARNSPRRGSGLSPRASASASSG